MILIEPNDDLRKQCQEVTIPDGLPLPSNAEFESVRNVIKTMLKDLVESGGVGIAAPQIGSNLRIVVIQPPDSQPTVMINPRITHRSRKTQEDIEGCLSLPGRRFLVHRHKSISVSYLNTWGMKVDAFEQGYRARIIQHEIDHLNGILISDRGHEVGVHKGETKNEEIRT